MEYKDIENFMIKMSKEKHENIYVKCKSFINDILNDKIDNEEKVNRIDSIFDDKYKEILGRGRTTLFDSVISQNFFSIKYPELNQLLDEDIPFYGMYNFGARTLKSNIEINNILKDNNYNLEDTIKDISERNGWILDDEHISDWRKFYCQNEIKKFIEDNVIDKQFDEVKEKVNRNGFHKTLNSLELK